MCSSSVGYPTDRLPDHSPQMNAVSKEARYGGVSLQGVHSRRLPTCSNRVEWVSHDAPATRTQYLCCREKNTLSKGVHSHNGRHLAILISERVARYPTPLTFAPRNKAFPFRGAWNKLSLLPKSARRRYFNLTTALRGMAVLGWMWVRVGLGKLRKGGGLLYLTKKTVKSLARVQGQYSLHVGG